MSLYSPHADCRHDAVEKFASYHDVDVGEVRVMIHVSVLVVQCAMDDRNFVTYWVELAPGLETLAEAGAAARTLLALEDLQDIMPAAHAINSMLEKVS